MEYTQERDRDFMNAYRREMRLAWAGEGPVERRIWEDLADRVESEMAGARGMLSLSEALARVLAEGNAPCFYIGPRTARRIVAKLRNVESGK